MKLTLWTIVFCVIGAGRLCADDGADDGYIDKLLDPRVVLPAMVRAAERSVVLQLDGKKSVRIDVIDPKWMEEFAAVLERAAYEPDQYCFCVSYPMAEFYVGERKLVISMPHGVKLRCYSGAISGDFRIGEKAAAELTRLMMNRKKVDPRPRSFMPLRKIPIPPLPPI